MDRIEENNWRQIEDLNQRGMQMLSVIDLILAGTVDINVAAFVCEKMSRGSSILTAAKPGGAGKTTVMAAFLGFIPPGTSIITVSDPSILNPNNPCHVAPEYLLVHEIGSGYYYGYIWGEDVKRYFSLIKPGRSIASNLHCDTIEELIAVLNGQLAVPLELIQKVDLLLFISISGSFMKMKRRVSRVYESTSVNHRLVFSHNPKNDNFECKENNIFSDKVKQMRAFLEQLVQQREFEYRAVRRRFLEFYPNLIKP